jgi:hypothetical protein
LIAANSVLGCFFFGYAIAYMNVSLNTIDEVFAVNATSKDAINGLISGL